MAEARCPTRLSALLDTSGLPDVLQPFGRTPIVNVDAPDAALANDPVVAATRPSVLKIRGVAPELPEGARGQRIRRRAQPGDVQRARRRGLGDA